ncbi:protein of unknown function [Methylorubrum extorquens]|uniref:Uncharacterized protein n=1 Tax=Methylorubrum extorquens TaxID=408 RepID=A0A2N9AHE4_METEX|nr:protein of unknown function [Methylorubrum extorquens]
MTAPAPTDARAEARERFYRAALWHAADPQCSNALAEFEDAYEALSALGKEAVTNSLARAAAARERQAVLSASNTTGRTDRA